MIKTVKLTWLTLILIALLGTPRISAQMAATKAYVEDVKEITDIMVYDVTSPVAAARYYAYITLTSYEIMAQEEKQNYSSFSNFF